MYVTEYKSAFYLYYKVQFNYLASEADTYYLRQLFENEQLMYENMHVDAFNRGE